MAKRILLVEDEPGLQLTLSDRLRSEGYEVEISGDGDSAYERATEETFDLIILDVMLPGKNGFDVCRDLRRDGMTQPILMLTARDQVADKVVGLKLGADDYLPKPFSPRELLARLRAVLRRRTPEAAPTAARRCGSAVSRSIATPGLYGWTDRSANSPGTSLTC